MHEVLHNFIFSPCGPSFSKKFILSFDPKNIPVRPKSTPPAATTTSLTVDPNMGFCPPFTEIGREGEEEEEEKEEEEEAEEEDGEEEGEEIGASRQAFISNPILLPAM